MKKSFVNAWDMEEQEEQTNTEPTAKPKKTRGRPKKSEEDKSKAMKYTLYIQKGLMEQIHEIISDDPNYQGMTISFFIAECVRHELKAIKASQTKRKIDDLKQAELTQAKTIEEMRAIEEKYKQGK